MSRQRTTHFKEIGCNPICACGTNILDTPKVGELKEYWTSDMRGVTCKKCIESQVKGEK